ncbi:unnamed protein product [Periconia digitata]|uniref:Uncharacterized protein n=1 Tax=Periconia digitata TaxID=1303443 RepID=A0A9W4UM92_9PLEO|nr:unnamed protein product [Periconia digitata]
MSSSQPAPRPGGYIDPNFPNPMGEGDATIIIYGYTPSLAVGVLGVVLFVLAGIAHAVALVRWRTWYFSTVLVGTAFVSLKFSLLCVWGLGRWGIGLRWWWWCGWFRI